ncbi:MAG: hypothetical protein LBV51_04990 [Acholeplasmatales bacterium]|jgi:hypothetical protein|nr:hypothetical protein [Acholeplasmatales bacterium]
MKEENNKKTKNNIVRKLFKLIGFLAFLVGTVAISTVFLTGIHLDNETITNIINKIAEFMDNIRLLDIFREHLGIFMIIYYSGFFLIIWGSGKTIIGRFLVTIALGIFALTANFFAFRQDTMFLLSYPKMGISNFNYGETITNIFIKILSTDTAKGVLPQLLFAGCNLFFILLFAFKKPKRLYSILLSSAFCMDILIIGIFLVLQLFSISISMDTAKTISYIVIGIYAVKYALQILGSIFGALFFFRK